MRDKIINFRADADLEKKLEQLAPDGKRGDYLRNLITVIATDPLIKLLIDDRIKELEADDDKRK